MTNYVVLKQAEDATDHFVVVKHVHAQSSEEAVRQMNEEGTFVPVPLRSWNVIEVTEETKPRLKLTRKGSRDEL